MTNSVILLHGDCRERMAEMEPESVDAIVCDPPYGLEFMGKEWDRLGATTEYPEDGEGPWGRQNRVRFGKSAVSMQSWHQTWAEEAYRVLKPGGHLLAFSGTRTSHRMVCAIEDAGFEIRDSLSWLYGSGFPKSLDVSKAIDKAAGAEREVVGSDTKARSTSGKSALPTVGGETVYESWDITSPATDLARQWQGWGTALKPAHEPICMARKPLVGTVATNVTEYGTGAINVDACRVGTGATLRTCNGVGVSSSFDMVSKDGRRVNGSTSGRWPANLILDEDAAAMLDQQSGERKAGVAVGRNASGGAVYGNGRGLISQPKGDDVLGYGDTGGASRFFYCAKSSRRERNAGLGGPDRVTAANSHPT